jgi:hypothetical protein
LQISRRCKRSGASAEAASSAFVLVFESWHIVQVGLCLVRHQDLVIAVQLGITELKRVPRQQDLFVVGRDHNLQLSVAPSEHAVHGAEFMVILVIDVGPDKFADSHIAIIGPQRIVLRKRNAGRLDSERLSGRARSRRLRDGRLSLASARQECAPACGAHACTPRYRQCASRQCASPLPELPRSSGGFAKCWQW